MIHAALCLPPQASVDSGVGGVCGVSAPPPVASAIGSVLGLVSHPPVGDSALLPSPVTVKSVQSVSTCNWYSSDQISLYTHVQ